jgi:hydroxymethylbilane synthase
MQLLRHRSDVRIDDIRGNVPTRINKLREGNYDAIVLAKAGLDRLNLDVSDLHSFEFDPTEFVPAPAQGVLACQIRSRDVDLTNILRKLHCEAVAELINVERKVLNLFEGGCQLPLGAYCVRTETGVRLYAIMARNSNGKASSVVIDGPNTEGLAERAVEELKKKAVH